MGLNKILHDEQIAMMRHSSATAPAEVNEHRREIDRIARTLSRFTYPHRPFLASAKDGAPEGAEGGES
jgi:hypothetical protein